MNEKLKILYVCSEIWPLVKTGGLADVAYGLTRALHRLGHDVRVALPCYGTISTEQRGKQQCVCVADIGFATTFGALRASVVPGTTIPLYLIEHNLYYSREHLYGTGEAEYMDNLERFCFFSLATLHGVPQTGWAPDIVHCNDWHTALIPAYIKIRELHHPIWRKKPTVFTIHNLGYQGRFSATYFPFTGLGWDLFRPDCLEFHGDINLMKGGIAFADRVNTVSPTYAKEILTPEHGDGLEGFLQEHHPDIKGILNCVDYAVWNPASDPSLASTYSPDRLAGKALCKKALQEELGLPQRDVPVFAMITRMVWHKGLDVVGAALDALLQRDLQLVVLGAGDPQLERRFAESAGAHPDAMRVRIAFDEALAHRILAGADFVLMPSHYEPGAVTQLLALKYGAIPIARKTGVFADTIRDCADDHDAPCGTGFLFEGVTADALLGAVNRATELFRDTPHLEAVRRTGMTEDFSWERSARQYLDLYRDAIASPCRTSL
ncbi:MAG: glycogen synthase GlgA [Candidatus Hydrogenedentes bacterium]|nr:glycogen synthase GlgA [Candidatus Hydrogenedentota bacterium]